MSSVELNRNRLEDQAIEQAARSGGERIAAKEKQLSAQTMALISLAAEISKQSDSLIVLTRWIIGLAVALGIIAVAQVWTMLVKGA